MAAHKHHRDLNDVALKPRLLHNILDDQLPNETTPFRNPADLAAIVSAIKTHQLLSEQFPTSSSVDQKILSSWNSAIDAWVDRNLLLARSNSPDKSWAGVCLLGVTCTRCSSKRFLSSFSDWFNLLVLHIQQPGVSELVRVASCAAASDLLTRLGGFSNTKKDGVSCAGKLVQPILKTLTGDATEEMLEVAAQLLYTVLTYFPSSLHRNYDNVETAVVSKIMSGNCSSNLLKKLACCLALLPKSKGDEQSWCLMIQKILLSLSALLDSALEQDLEEESRRGKVVALLVPPGKAPPPPLGGEKIGGEAITNGERSQQFVISIISCLMQCCCTMLTSSYQVVVPVRALLAIIERVLMVNGSLPERPFTTVKQQEHVCLHLPALHQNVLELLTALQKGLQSQVLPHAAEIACLLTKYLERCWVSELRTKTYTVIRSLLISMGAGMAFYISKAVIDNGLTDLANFRCDKEHSSQVSVEPSTLHDSKRRKHGSAKASFCSEVKEPQEPQASISLYIAAVEALEALIIVGGSLGSDSWRSSIDDLLMEVVTNACKGGWNHAGKPILVGGSGTVSEDFQLVAMRAFLASLLSPASVRSPYLAQGLELFLKGKQNGGTKVAEFCAQALLALEVLIHPRALPLVDAPLQTGNGSSYRDFGGSNSKFSGVYSGSSFDVLDYLTMKDNFGSEVLDISKHQEPDVVDDLSEKMAPKERKKVSEPTSIDEKLEGKKDLVMLDVPPPSVSYHDDTLVLPGYPPLHADVAPGNDVPHPMNKESKPGVESAMASSTFDTSRKRKLDDDDENSFPDIIDADPDTDPDY